VESAERECDSLLHFQCFGCCLFHVDFFSWSNAFICLMSDQVLQDNQKCGQFGFRVSSSLMRGCQNLSVLKFQCSDWQACVASDSWVGLPVPPPEVIARGTESVFSFVKAVLQGGAFASRSCRVMVVGPQMVHALARIVDRVLTAAAGWQDQPDQRAERRPVSAHRP
jgi:hypothetical protein